MVETSTELTIVNPHIESTPDDPFLVTFNTPTDDGNPQNWLSKKKWTITWVLSLTGFNRIMVSTIMAPALSTISRELHMSDIEAVMALSAYVLATAFGPLIMGPLSEICGRKPVMHATNIWFLVWNLVCGFARNKGELIAARLLAGLGASAIYALQGGVLGDVWPPERRGKVMGIYALIPLLGAAVGPIIGGFITEMTTWRWMFWSTSILQGIMVCMCLGMFDETHGPTILRKRARALRRTTEDSRYHTQWDSLESGRSLIWILQRSLSRPIRMLLFHPIIQVQACLSGFIYGLLYLVLSTFADLWTTRYHESIVISGLHYISLCLGEMVGSIIGGRLLDISFRRLTRRTGGEASPEFRIPSMLPGAIVTPLGLFIYGWAAQRHAHWLVVGMLILHGAVFSRNGILTQIRSWGIHSFFWHADRQSIYTSLCHRLLS
jgi:multidrug resistance protein